MAAATNEACKEDFLVKKMCKFLPVGRDSPSFPEFPINF